MSRQCELSGKGVMTGNNVSHAKNRTRRRFLPNLCNVSLASDKLNQTVRFRVSARALRSVEHVGGLYIAQPPLYRAKKGSSVQYLKDDKQLDNFLIKAKVSNLSTKAQKLKKRILSS